MLQTLQPTTLYATPDQLNQWRFELGQILDGSAVESVPSALDASAVRWLPMGEVLEALDREETGDAELLAELYKGRLAYDHTENTWYLWDGERWTRDKCGFVGGLVSGSVAAQYLYAAAEICAKKGKLIKEEEEEVKQLGLRAGVLRKLHRIRNVLSLASSLPDLALTGEEWDTDPWVLGCANGVIDLRDGTFRPTLPGDYIKRSVPTRWTGIDTPSPKWERFLAEVFASDQDLINFIQRLLGYGITKLGTEHKLTVLWGRGRNGKDTLLETLNRTLGPVASAVSTDVILSRNRNPGQATPNTYALRELRIAWASETNEEATLDAGRVKHLTGGGSIVARPLYGSPITFQPGFLLMLMTNYKPHAGAGDYALWKRILLIPFTQSFIEDPDPTNPNEHQVIPDMADQLVTEASGILAWLVRGCLAWQAEGLNPPDVVRMATREYQQEEDVVAQFIEDECVIDPNAEIKTTRLYDAYRDWAKSSGLRPMSSNAFGRELTRKSYKRKRRRGGRYYVGLTVVV